MGELRALVPKLDVERVIFAQLEESEAPSILRSLRSEDVQIDMVARPLEATMRGGRVHMLDGVPILGVSFAGLSQSFQFLKRTMDIALAGAGLLLVSPLLAVIAILIKVDSRGPVLYRHERIGRDRRPFKLLKFRTMHKDYCRGHEYGGEKAERMFARLMQDPAKLHEFESSYKLLSDPRVTRFGAFLRRTSMDELPQLVNVLRGDLSLVGPRPIVAQGDRALRSGCKRSSRVAPRAHRFLADKRPVRYQLWRARPARHGLREQLVASA